MGHRSVLVRGQERRNKTCLQGKYAVKSGDALSSNGKPKLKRKYKLTLKSLKRNTFTWSNSQFWRLSMSSGVWSANFPTFIWFSPEQESKGSFWHYPYSNKCSMLHLSHGIQYDVMWYHSFSFIFQCKQGSMIFQLKFSTYWARW